MPTVEQPLTQPKAREVQLQDRGEGTWVCHICSSSVVNVASKLPEEVLLREMRAACWLIGVASPVSSSCPYSGTLNVEATPRGQYMEYEEPKSRFRYELTDFRFLNCRFTVVQCLCELGLAMRTSSFEHGRAWLGYTYSLRALSISVNPRKCRYLFKSKLPKIKGSAWLSTPTPSSHSSHLVHLVACLLYEAAAQAQVHQWFKMALHPFSQPWTVNRAVRLPQLNLQMSPQL